MWLRRQGTSSTEERHHDSTSPPLTRVPGSPSHYTSTMHSLDRGGHEHRQRDALRVRFFPPALFPHGAPTNFSYREVDSTFFVLTVDLWSSDARQEVNLVRASSGAPTVSISTSTLTSYPPHIERGWQDPGPYSLMNQRGGYSTAPPGYAMNPAPHMPHQMPAYHQAYPGASPITAPQMPQYPGQYGAPPPGHPSYQVAPQAMPVMPPTAPATSSATGMFTRNLIGSLSVNAFRLNDTTGKMGFWFVLQDLSVRTEGVFR